MPIPSSQQRRFLPRRGEINRGLRTRGERHSLHARKESPFPTLQKSKIVNPWSSITPIDLFQRLSTGNGAGCASTSPRPGFVWHPDFPSISILQSRTAWRSVAFASLVSSSSVFLKERLKRRSPSGQPGKFFEFYSICRLLQDERNTLLYRYLHIS